MDAAMKPLIEWAREHEPNELEAVFPNERMVYTEEAARRWISIARRWRAAHTDGT
jgi:hypothetical protein